MKLSWTRALALASVVAAVSGCQWASSLGLTSKSWNLSKKATRQETRELAGLDAHETLWLEVGSGDIRIETVTGQAPSMEATFTAYGSTDDDAARSLAKTQLDVDTTPSGVRITVLDDLVEHHSDDVTIRMRSRVDFVLRVPSAMALHLETHSGNIDASGPFDGSVLESRYGKVRIQDVQGDLNASSNSGDVEVANVRGERLTVKSGYGRIEVARAEAKQIEIGTSSGDIDLEHILGKTIAVDSGYGDVDLADIQGDLDARSSSGTLRGRRIAGDHVRMRSGYGGVRVEDSKGDFQLNTSSGDVSVVRLEGKLEARSGYGSVDVDGTFTAMDLSTTSGNVKARARRGSAVSAEWQVHSGYGNVDLALPADLGCRIEARTAYGELKLDVPLDDRGAGSSSERSISGTLRGGGETIQVETGSGNVHVHAVDE